MELADIRGSYALLLSNLLIFLSQIFRWKTLTWNGQRVGLPRDLMSVGEKIRQSFCYVIQHLMKLFITQQVSFVVHYKFEKF